MAYRIDSTHEADDDIGWFKPVERSAIAKALPKYLRDTPTVRSTHRKKMEPNPLDAPWELRLGPLRVFYRVDEDRQIVLLLRAGRKLGNIIFIRGIAYDLREELEGPAGP